MEIRAKNLLDQLSTCDLEGGPTSLPFVAKLAKEQRWKRSYAERVVAEYRRFLFLAAVSDHAVTPSAPVDEAWHQHLTHTENYRQMCQSIFGRFLDHIPSRGGHEEEERHLRQYVQTLASYRQWFGDEPPKDIWPAPGRKPQTRLTPALIGLIAILVTAGCASTITRTDDPFVGLLLVLGGSALVITLALLYIFKLSKSGDHQCNADGCGAVCGGSSCGSGGD